MAKKKSKDGTKGAKGRKGSKNGKASRKAPLQRLLYLHARTPSPLSEVLGYTPIEPVAGFRAEIVADEADWPYRTVHDAVVDGWQIVQFPQHQAPYDDRDVDVVGYEFILQKME